MLTTTDVSQAERLARLETNMEQTMNTVARIDAKLDVWQTNYPTRSEVDEMFKSRDVRLETLERERQNTRLSIPQWLMVVATFGSVGVAIALLLKKG